jgi:phosphoglycerate dehydrogenase-like enzyme
MPCLLINARLPAETAERLRAIPNLRVSFSERGLAEHHAAVEFPPEEIRDVDLLVCTAPPKNFADMRALKFIQLASVGFGQLYGLDIVSRGIRVANARGVYDTAIGEWNLAMMINLARDLRGMIRNQEHGIFEKLPRFAQEIRGSVVGLWGYGGIGRETARLAKALGMKVHVYARGGIQPRRDTYAAAGTGDPEGRLPDNVFTTGQELEFLSGVDFLVLALPLTPQSTGIIGERELRALQPTAFVLNPARGPLIQEAALLRALREGWIAGAALDTHYYYPMPADHPLWRFPNVIMTPHISGSDLGPLFVERMSEILEHNVRQFLSGGALWNELTPEELRGER